MFWDNPFLIELIKFNGPLLRSKVLNIDAKVAFMNINSVQDIISQRGALLLNRYKISVQIIFQDSLLSVPYATARSP